MSSKVILVLCVQTLFVQIVLSQCTSRAAVAADAGYLAPGAYGLGASCGLGAPYGLIEPELAAPYDIPASWGFCGPAVDFTPTSGGGLPVSSSSPIAPIGISIVSENVFEGPLLVTGELPLVGTVAMEGVLPSVGSGAINHACGNGVNAMISDITAFAPGYVEAFAPGYGGAITPGYAGSIAPAYGGPIVPGYPGPIGCGYAY